MKKVWLDAGHGGLDPGASGNGLVEKLITLPVALKVGKIIKRHGVEVGQTRTADTTVDLNKRAVLANNFNADAFVSIHTNAFTNASAKGVETYNYPSSSNGNKLATDIHNSMLESKLYTINRGVKTANFAVLRQTKMPSCLVELGFITNESDANILKNKQDELAESVAKGILKYLGVKYQEEKINVLETKIEGQNIVRIKKDNKIIEVEGFMQNESNFVKVRDVFEKFGHKVSWDNENKIVLID